MTTENTYKIATLTAIKPAGMIDTPSNATIAQLNLPQRRLETIVHPSEIKAILPLAPDTSEQPLKALAAGATESVPVVPQNARTIILRHNDKPLFVATSIRDVFNDNEKIEPGIFSLIWNANPIVAAEPVTKATLQTVIATNKDPNASPRAQAAYARDAASGRFDTYIVQEESPTISARGEPASQPARVIVGRIETPVAAVQPRHISQPVYIPEDPVEEVGARQTMNRRRAIIIGTAVAAAAAIFGILKSTELPKLTLQEKQDLIDQAEAEGQKKNSGGIQFYTPDAQIVYYNGDDLKNPQIQKQIKTNILDDFYRSGDVFYTTTPDNQNNLPEDYNPPSDDGVPDTTPLRKAPPAVIKSSTKGSVSPVKKTSLHEGHASRPTTALSRRAFFEKFALKKANG